MSKLTEQQKAANKAAQKIRDRAFSQRRREFNKALTVATERAAGSCFATQMHSANEDFERELQNRSDAIEDVTRRIAELEAEKGRVRANYELSIRPKQEARDAAFAAFRAHERALMEEVEQRYPDIAGIWYVSQWVIPADVQAQMDAARDES